MDKHSYQTLNVLMVDDEFMILKGLEKMIDWKGLNLKLVATATDGQQALEYLSQHSVDIIISDINMPCLNGIDLIRNIQQEYTQIEFIFISGYQRFDYVRDGLRLGVANYLLKPIDKQELHEALIQVINKIQQRVDKGRLPFSNEKEKMQIIQWLQSNDIATPIKEKQVQLYLIQKATDESTDNLVEDITSLSKNMIVFSDTPTYMIVLPLVSSEFLDISYMKQVSIETVDLPFLYKNCQQRAQEYEFYLSHATTEVIHCYAMASFELKEEKLTLKVSELTSRVYQMIDLKQMWRLPVVFEELIYVMRNLAMSRLEVIRIFQSFLVYYEGKSRFEITGWTIESIVEAVLHQFKITDTQRQYQQLHPIIQEVLEYIDTHYAQEMTLHLLAEKFHINAMYLGQLFKKNSGVSFSKYLNDFRISKAKQQLLQTNLTIAQIGENVGYDNQAYFYRMFKTVEGISPKEYRAIGKRTKES